MRIDSLTSHPSHGVPIFGGREGGSLVKLGWLKSPSIGCAGMARASRSRVERQALRHHQWPAGRRLLGYLHRGFGPSR